MIVEILLIPVIFFIRIFMSLNLSSSLKLVSIASLVVLTGCSSLNQSAVSPSLKQEVTTEFKADVEVGKKTTGKSTTTVILGFIKLGDSQFADGVSYGTGFSFSLGGAEGAKSAAAYKAIKAANADILVAPTYIVKEEGFGPIYTTIEAEVTGFAGTVKGVKQK
jgi:hypothetical protein